MQKALDLLADTFEANGIGWKRGDQAKDVTPPFVSIQKAPPVQREGAWRNQLDLEIFFSNKDIVAASDEELKVLAAIDSTPCVFPTRTRSEIETIKGTSYLVTTVTVWVFDER